MEYQPITPDKIDELLEFLPVFQNPNFEATKQTSEKDTYYPEYSDRVLRFFDLASQPCWKDYKYEPETAGRLVRDHKGIEKADLAIIKTMITYCLRGERFCDGYWELMLKEGVIVAILKRLQILRNNQ